MTSPPPRRPSFGMLLRRSKSGEFGKAGKKAQAIRDADLERQRQRHNPPKLPEFRNAPTESLSDLHGYSLVSGPPSRPSRDAPRTTNFPPVPPVPFDPYARTESMTHRGRYSYASSAVSTVAGPRRIRRRKDPTPFNVLVVGSRSAGKTSFLEFLKTALALPVHKRPTKKADEDDFNFPTPATGNFIPHYLETETDGERVGLTLWDSEGLDKNVVDLQLRDITAFLESKFDETFGEEMKVIRSPGVKDTHIHAVLLILDPARLDRNMSAAKKLSNGYRNGAGAPNGPSPLDDAVDMQVLRALYGKTTVIPVIAKADTITAKHMSVLKRAVWDSIKKARLDPLEALALDDDAASDSGRIDEADEDQAADEDDDDESKGNDAERQSPSPSAPGPGLSASPRRNKAQDGAKDDERPFLPFSIISPDLYEPDVIGRRFPWGFADPYNDQHCDFQRLKEAVFTEWRGDLREASREQWYEGWRTNRLKQGDLPYRAR